MNIFYRRALVIDFMLQRVRNRQRYYYRSASPKTARTCIVTHMKHSDVLKTDEKLIISLKGLQTT